MNRILTFTAGLILVWIIGYLLIAGRGLLIPIVIALFIWNLLNTIHISLQKIPWIGDNFPDWLSKVLAFLVVIGMVAVVIDIITNNVNDVIAASSRYQENLTNIFNGIDQHYRLRVLKGFDGFLKDLSVQGVLVNIYAVFTAITSSAVLIILYVIKNIC